MLCSIDINCLIKTKNAGEIGCTDAPYQLENKKAVLLFMKKGGTSHVDWRSGK
jgi:hypothetical protein